MNTMQRWMIAMLMVGGCASQAQSPAEDARGAAPVASDDGVRFSFAVNGLEHGNGAL